MKDFMQVLRRFVMPYKKYVALSILFNILSALLNIFSFAAIIPILQILFKTRRKPQKKRKARKPLRFRAFQWS